MGVEDSTRTPGCQVGAAKYVWTVERPTTIMEDPTMLDTELIEYLDRRFDAVDRRFDAVDRRFDAVDQRFGAVDRRFAHVDRRFAESADQFRQIHILIEHLETQIRLVAEGVDANNEALSAFRVDVDRQFSEVKDEYRHSYAQLDRRLAALEKRATS
jgi:hypothetical protein